MRFAAPMPEPAICVAFSTSYVPSLSSTFSTLWTSVPILPGMTKPTSAAVSRKRAAARTVGSTQLRQSWFLRPIRPERSLPKR